MSSTNVVLIVITVVHLLLAGCISDQITVETDATSHVVENLWSVQTFSRPSAMSRDYRMLACRSSRSSNHYDMVETATGLAIRTIDVGFIASYVALSDDAKLFAAFGTVANNADAVLRVWSVNDGSAVADVTFRGVMRFHAEPVFAIEFSPIASHVVIYENSSSGFRASLVNYQLKTRQPLFEEESFLRISNSNFVQRENPAGILVVAPLVAIDREKLRSVFNTEPELIDTAVVDGFYFGGGLKTYFTAQHIGEQGYSVRQSRGVITVLRPNESAPQEFYYGRINALGGHDDSEYRDVRVVVSRKNRLVACMLYSPGESGDGRPQRVLIVDTDNDESHGVVFNQGDYPVDVFWDHSDSRILYMCGNTHVYKARVR